MAYRKIIYWNPSISDKDGKKWANMHLIGNYPKRVQDYNEMAAEMRKTFPDASDEVVECSVITDSTYNKHFAIITYGAYIAPDGNYEGWEIAKHRPDYHYA